MNLLTDLVLKKIDLVKHGANTAAFIKLYKGRKQSMNFEEIIAKMATEDAAVILAELAKVKKEVEDAKAEIEVIKKEKSKATNTNEDPYEQAMKAASPEIQEVLKSMKEKKEAAELAAKTVANQAKEDEAIAKAKSLKNVPMEEDKLVEVLKSADQSVIDMLVEVNKQMEKGLGEIGSGQESEAKGTSADEIFAQIEKKASKLREVRTELTKEAAIAEVTKSDRDLYRKYLNALQG